MKKIISLLIIMTLVFSCMPINADEIRSSASNELAPQELPTEVKPEETKPEESKPTIVFSDVKEDSDVSKDIYKLVNAGILNGYADGTFRPNNPITRAELCKVINLAFNYTEADTTAFTDVKKEDWFYNYVLIAKKAGYITGHANGTFKGNDFLTREQTCAVITRVVDLYSLTMTEKITDTVSEWAVPYVNKVVANRIIPLEAGGKFRATQNITRGELVSAIAKFVVVKPDDGTKEEIVKYTVTFNSNEGSSVSPVTVESGKTVAKPVNPTKTGYTFNGWYSDNSLKTAFDFNSKIIANITLYAKWTKASAGGGGGGGTGGSGSSGGTTVTKYTVNFIPNGGNSVASASVEKGKTVSKPADPTRNGYTFDGWYSDNSLTNKFDFNTKITSNVTLYAKWIKNEQAGGDTPGGSDTPTTPTVKTYNVTFMSNGGSSVPKVSVESGSYVDEPEAPFKEGYRFDGWYKESNFRTIYDFSAPVVKHLTLYAKWTRVYTVSFETNGGEYIESVIVEAGSAVDQPDHGEWPGYYFMGWYKDSEFMIPYKFESVVSKDITLYAKWIEFDQSKQDEAVATMTTMRDKIVEIRFEGYEQDIIDVAVEVVALVLEDAESGKLIYDGEYILDNYGDLIGPATEIYHYDMSEDERTTFYSKLVTELGEADADNLLQIMFGISLEDAKDKVQN